MAKEKQINATVTNEEQDAKKQPEGKKIDKAEIINMIGQLPIKERMDLIRDLQNVSAKDADAFSVGDEGTSRRYDTLRDEYQKKAKEAEEQEPEETK